MMIPTTDNDNDNVNVNVNYDLKRKTKRSEPQLRSLPLSGWGIKLR